MIVYVRLAEVLLLLVFVGLVIVGNLRMVVLMTMGGHQVRDVLPVTAVMGHVAVIVVMNCGIVGMHVRHGVHLLLRCALAGWAFPSLRRASVDHRSASAACTRVACS